MDIIKIGHDNRQAFEGIRFLWIELPVFFWKGPWLERIGMGLLRKCDKCTAYAQNQREANQDIRFIAVPLFTHDIFRFWDIQFWKTQEAYQSWEEGATTLYLFDRQPKIRVFLAMSLSIMPECLPTPYRS